MTTLVCWYGRDSRGPASLYMATDSRFSWGVATTWNVGRKMLVMSGQPQIFGFAGDVVFGQTLLTGLPSALQLQEEGLIQSAVIAERLRWLTRAYPDRSAVLGSAVVHARRGGEGMTAQFLVSSYKFVAGEWQAFEHPLPEAHSDIVCAFGSGADLATSEVRRWMEQDVSDRTSRSVFSGFCSALRRAADPRSGGPPQLAGLYRKGGAREFGIVWDGALFVGGFPLNSSGRHTSTECRNELLPRQANG